tara:strand:+ start:40 stop:648 length:609 start_codon:yes stop_codon:yes gene_type:complete
MNKIIFGSLLYINTVNFDNKKIISEIDNTVSSFKKTKKNVKHDKHNFYVLEKPKFNKLKKQIMKEIKEYTKNVMQWDSDFKITTSWFTEINKGDSSQLHNHRNCFLSGVIYLQVNPQSGNILFENRMTQQIFYPKVLQHNEFNADSYSIAPQNGMILIFPSQICHLIEKNKSDLTRYSLAFNVMPVGSVGDVYTDSHTHINH